MRGILIKKVVIGFICGLLANALGIYLYLYVFAPLSVESTLETAISQGFIGKIISIGAIFNLALFFYFLQSDFKFFKKDSQPYQARGVLLATVVTALVILYFKF